MCLVLPSCDLQSGCNLRHDCLPRLRASSSVLQAIMPSEERRLRQGLHVLPRSTDVREFATFYNHRVEIKAPQFPPENSPRVFHPRRIRIRRSDRLIFFLASS